MKTLMKTMQTQILKTIKNWIIIKMQRLKRMEVLNRKMTNKFHNPIFKKVKKIRTINSTW